MQIRPGLELANVTDIGCERENNEDYFCYWEPQSDTEFLRKGRLAVVADGMGGEEGGEIASRLAVDSVRNAYVSPSEGDPHESLIQGFKAAHDAILAAAREQPGLQGMGTTCTAVAITNGHAHVAHIGDSRLYLIRGSSISKLTNDHTAIGKMIEQGIITPDQAATHPQRHILTAALGASRDVSAEFSPAPIPLRAGDVLVLCTDGLWGQITDEELVSTISSNAPAAACKQLVHLAKSRGGPDNITVQILHIEGERNQAAVSNGN